MSILPAASIILVRPPRSMLALALSVMLLKASCLKGMSGSDKNAGGDAPLAEDVPLLQVPGYFPAYVLNHQVCH